MGKSRKYTKVSSSGREGALSPSSKARNTLFLMPNASAQSCTLRRAARRASRINTPSFFVRMVICDFVSIKPLQVGVQRLKSLNSQGHSKSGDFDSVLL